MNPIPLHPIPLCIEYRQSITGSSEKSVVAVVVVIVVVSIKELNKLPREREELGLQNEISLFVEISGPLAY